MIQPELIKYKLFFCTKSKSELRMQGKTGALNYISWGEAQRTGKGARHTISGIPFPNVPSVKGNSPWYALRPHRAGDFALAALVRERYKVVANRNKIIASNMFYEGDLPDGIDKLIGWAVLNSTIVYFFMEVFGRLNIGGRLNFYSPEFHHIYIPNPLIFKTKGNINILCKAFDSLSQRPVLSIIDEV